MLKNNKLSSHLIQIYGAERVGKTTFCTDFIKKNSNYNYIHYGVPRLDELTSLSNYNLDKIKNKFIITDRGPLEANIFRPTKIKDIRYLYQEIFLNAFDKITIYIMEKPFINIIDRHKKELIENYKKNNLNIQKWKLNSDLQKRCSEHYEYYQKFYANIYELYDIIENVELKILNNESI